MNEPAISPLYPESVAAAEQSLAALLLVDGNSVSVQDLKPNQFFNINLGTIWEVGTRMVAQNTPVDIVTLADGLAHVGKLDAVGGFAYLSKLLMCHADVQLAAYYAEVVRKAWQARELRRVASEVPGALDQGADVHEVSTRLRAFLDRVEVVSDATCTSLAAECTAEYSRIEADIERLAKGQAAETGLPTGLGLEQYVPGGIPRDRLTLLFGPTGTFKTAIKQWMCDTIAAHGKYVLDFTLEDSAELTAQRFLARRTGIPYGRIASRQLSARELQLLASLEDTARAVASRTIVVGNVPGTVEEAIRLSRYWARQVPLAAVFVDYIQLIEGSARNQPEHERIYTICKAAQRAAHRDKLAWVLVSQVNRRGSDRENKAPLLSDLYGSSGIQQTTKLAVGIHRPFDHDAVPPVDSIWAAMYANHPDGPARYKGALELWIRKSVSGETNVCVPVVIDPGTGCIETLTPGDL